MRLQSAIVSVGLVTAFAVTVAENVADRYDPTWASLDTRPLPEWFDESKLGIFIHWGVYSEIGYNSEWVWWYWKGWREPIVMRYFAENFPPDMTYADFAATFRAAFFDPVEWADLIAKSGAKYVVLTAKHHEGYTLWPSNHSFNWNSMDVGPHRDLVGDLAAAIRSRTDLHFGLYHSLFEWFHPLYLQDKAAGWATQDFVRSKTLPELYEIVNSYKPEVIWSDGDWEAPFTYWNSTEFLAWLYNDSPVKNTVLVNDRWGNGMACNHGGYYTCQDKYNPGVLQPKKWENCMTLDDQSWGYRRNIREIDVLPMADLIGMLAATVSCGGNFLLNIGPSGDGTIPAIFQERLRQLGQWMDINGEAIYKTVPWSRQNDTINSDVWYTSKQTPSGVDVYALVLKWDTNATTIILGAPKVSANTQITLLGSATAVKYRAITNGIEVVLPPLQSLPPPLAWGYVFKLTQLRNRPHAKRILPLPERFRKKSRIQHY